MQQELSHSVYQKLQKLVREHEHLKKENSRLQQQLDEHQAKAGTYTQRVAELENQVIALKNSTGNMDAEAKKDMERRINQYIKDIDNAIMLLHE